MNAPIKFLLVEDNDLDAVKISRSMTKLALDNPVIRARDGIEALDILRGKNSKAKLTQPYIILLDLHMPRMHGIELLRHLREDPQLKDAYVYVLTTSDRPEDIATMQKYQVAGYVVKDIAKKSVTPTFEAALKHLLTRFKKLHAYSCTQ